MAALATALTAAGVGISALGTYQAGQAQAEQAKGQQAMAEYNAQVARQEAKALETRSLYESRLQNKEAQRIGSSLEAGLAASGVSPSAGTPLLIQATQAAESEMENLMIGYEGRTAAGRAMSQSKLDTMQAGIYGTAAKNYSRGGMIGAGATLLTGFGKMAARKYGY